MYSKGYQAADQDHQSAYTTHQTSEEIYENCVTKASIEKALTCYKRAYNTDREQERAEDDLDAQREMANWAEAMLWATLIIGTITASATVAGAIFVALTLKATSDTLKAGIKATEAAQNANKITQAINLPHLAIVNWKFLGISDYAQFMNSIESNDGFGSSNMVGITASLTNLGGSPALIYGMGCTTFTETPYVFGAGGGGSISWSEQETVLKMGDELKFSTNGFTLQNINARKEIFAAYYVEYETSVRRDNIKVLWFKIRFHDDTGDSATMERVNEPNWFPKARNFSRIISSKTGHKPSPIYRDYEEE